MASNPRDAQRVCEALTSKIVQKNLEFIQANAKGTVDVLTQGLDDAKRTLDDMDAKLADFKRQHSGQLPTDQDANLKMLMTLTSSKMRSIRKRILRSRTKPTTSRSWRSSFDVEVAQNSTNPGHDTKATVRSADPIYFAAGQLHR